MTATRVLPKEQIELLRKGGYQQRSIETAVRRVNAGMALLDGVSPEWMTHMNLDRLEMSSGAYCVLGQAFGDFYEGQCKLKLSDRKAENCGFYTESYTIYGVLDVVWTHAITARNRAGRRVFLRMPA